MPLDGSGGSDLLSIEPEKAEGFLEEVARISRQNRGIGVLTPTGHKFGS